MVAYQGGKSKIGQEIYEIIKEYEFLMNKQNDNIYFEPFCGLLGVGIHFSKDGRQILANDKNKSLILMLKSLKQGWIPPKKEDKKMYEKYRKSKTPSALKGFYGFAGTYNGIFFKGLRGERGERGGRDYFKNFRDSLIDRSKFFKNITFKCCDYRDYNPKGLTIYCDPPYKGNKFITEYFQDFDHEEFWNIIREWSKYNLVIISEFEAPEDFKCIWSKKTSGTFNKHHITNLEKLFVHEKRIE